MSIKGTFGIHGKALHIAAIIDSCIMQHVAAHFTLEDTIKKNLCFRRRNVRLESSRGIAVHSMMKMT